MGQRIASMPTTVWPQVAKLSVFLWRSEFLSRRSRRRSSASLPPGHSTGPSSLSKQLPAIPRSLRRSSMLRLIMCSRCRTTSIACTQVGGPNASIEQARPCSVVNGRVMPIGTPYGFPWLAVRFGTFEKDASLLPSPIGEST